MGLDTVELVMAFEEEFELQIPDDEAEGLMTIGLTTDWITTRLSSLGRAVPRADVLARVIAVTARQLGMRPDQLREPMSFVDDLRMD